MFGADFDKAINWAAAVELVHNASLVHDDLCDGDFLRRGNQTIFKKYGAAIAVCLGDYYIATGYRLAALAGPQTINLFSDCIVTSVGGQASEFFAMGYPTWSQYSDIAVRKTAPLLSLSISGAAAANDYPLDQKSVDRYVSQAAICFQIINDLHNFNETFGTDRLCSDLAKSRPNAVLACFSDTLAAPKKALFDHWNDQTRSGVQQPDASETQEWWQWVQRSEAHLHALHQLSLHFNAADNALLRLTPRMQDILTDLQQWLADEVSNARCCVTINREKDR
jgi:geranylgeranyl pyrophosphate synthase